MTKAFERWRAKEGLSHRALCKAMDELERGLIDANLGGGLYKKRASRIGTGKSGGYRTLIAARFRDRAIFVFGFAKNERDNIDRHEERALKAYAAQLLGYDASEVARAVKAGEWIRLRCDHG
jgi:hypothetical protein